MTSCGTCILWSPNCFPNAKAWEGRRNCCADTVMDLPASWDRDREMEASDGAYCPIWEEKK